ncbi:hypothetical protein [Actinomyces israelii]|uniref:hypothetical protein n=1 Tax=Actinomyces israelii TaxID=1659 RepID=UPI002556EC62|nr:hypothetical protein [Actinomyces israelii]WKR20173.1 hypothetical protein AIF0345_0040 [Actinomyces israelii]
MSNRIPDKPAGGYGVDALVVAIMLSLSALALLSGTIVNIAQSAPAWISLMMGIWTIAGVLRDHLLVRHPAREVPRVGQAPGLPAPEGR